MSKIRSMSITTEGQTEPVEKVEREASEIQAATERWIHLQDQVKGKRWSDCPPEMVADFIKSTAKDVDREFGRNGMSKMIISAAVARFRIDPENLDMRLSCQSADGQGGIEMVLSTEPENLDREEEEFTAVELDVDMSQEDLDSISNKSSTKDVLDAVMKNNKSRKREVFNPLAVGSVEDEQIVQLVRDIEQQLPIVDGNRQENEFDVMFTAAGVLLVWKNAEITNASTSTFSLNGLYNRDEKVYPGLTVKAVCQTQIHDQDLTIDDNEDLVSANISVTKPRKVRP